MLLLRDFSAMGPRERRRALAEMLNGPAPSDSRIEAEILALERRYAMTSREMRARVCAGLDTADTARWLVLLAAIGR